MYGYCGRIAHINVSNGQITVEKPNEEFYRKYMGGSCLGTYYVLEGTKPGIDPLGPENVLTFAASGITGAAISGASRSNANAKSPLTGGIGDSQAGGYWGPSLKWAGFDALVIQGAAEKPVYIFIKNGEISIRDASHLWGKTTGETQQTLSGELGEKTARFAIIGQGGENLVRYASIACDLNHYYGRNGMGAVMGSKKIKAIVVKGTTPPDFYDSDTIKGLVKESVERINNNPLVKMLHEYGTANGVAFNNSLGGLPSYNYSQGIFEQADLISGEHMANTILQKKGTCWSCAVRCKRVVKSGEPYNVDSTYGGPEYETIAGFGSNLGISDIEGIAKANELCNKYGLDTMSLGGTIAWAMESYEKGILTKEDTDGIELTFGNVDALLTIIEKIARREGFGDLLAEGSVRAAEKVGKGSEKYAMHSKKQEIPYHMPRTKASLALAYACNPFGADHQSSAHDPALEIEPMLENMKNLGLQKNESSPELDFEKAKLFTYSQRAYSALDSLDLCHFCYGYFPPLFEMKYAVDLLNAATGWETTLWELLIVGERRMNMMRYFNFREGFTPKDDVIPERLHEALKGGVSDGYRIDKTDFFETRNEYYALAGLDPESGCPTDLKLKELDIYSVCKEVAE